MTLIATVISQHGIIHASDSNLTNAAGAVTPGQKVFRLGWGDAALSVAGAYCVGGQPLDASMKAAIDDFGTIAAPTIAGFAEYLRGRLTAEADPARGSLIHIAGYVEDSGRAHPAFYFVRNISRINPDGSYGPPKNEFDKSEDFWTRAYPKRTVPNMFDLGGSQLYFNGFPDGRIAYLAVNQWLQDFYNRVWSREGWRFRVPATLDELAGFVEHDIRVICTLFNSSDYNAAYIGGEVQVEKIAAPANAVKL